MPRPAPDRFSQRFKRNNPGDILPEIREERQQPEGMAALQNLGLTGRDKKVAEFCAGGRAKGTTSQHNGVIKEFFTFCEKRGFDKKDVSTMAMEDFLMWADEVKKPYSWTLKAKGSLLHLLASLNIPIERWKHTTQRIHESMQRRAAVDRRPIKKAEPLPIKVLGNMVQKVFDKDDVMMICGVDSRTVAGCIVQFYTLARSCDIRNLRACDLKLTEQGGRECIEITFRKSKNDKHYEGKKGWIFKEHRGGWQCPVNILKTYYQRMGFSMRNRQICDLSYFMTTVRVVQGIQIADGARPIAASTYLADLRQLCAEVGHLGPISSKSAKVAGTSAAYAAGLTTLDLQAKGRWSGEGTSLHYRKQTPEYRRRIGTATSIFKEVEETQPALDERRISASAAANNTEEHQDRPTVRASKRTADSLVLSEHSNAEAKRMKRTQANLKRTQEMVWQDQQELTRQRSLLFRDRTNFQAEQWRFEQQKLQFSHDQQLHKKKLEALIMEKDYWKKKYRDIKRQ